jgi:hypothetical protein
MKRLTGPFALLLLLIALADEATSQPQPGQRPPSAAVVDALVDAIAAGDELAARHFLEQHATPAYRESASWEQHAAEFDRMHRALGRAAVLGLSMDPLGERWAQLRSGVDGEVYVLRLTLTDDGPPKVEALQWEPEQPVGPLTAAARREALERLYRLVERVYVMPDTAQMITAHLRERAAAGAYDDLTERADLAAVLTADLQAVNGDRHLYVRADSGGGAPGGGPGAPVTRPGPSAAPSEGPAAIGFTRVDLLEGNVAYIELGGPLGRMPPNPAADAELVAEVVRAVEGADAVILDLRRSPGGFAQLANLLVSHFLPPDVHLFTVEDRFTGQVERRHTLSAVPGPRLLDTPLYVLTSDRTFSAGEDIAFALASQGRATLVGQSTAGGGRNNMRLPLGQGLTASISFTRVLDPLSGGEAWERRGIVPDVEVPAGEALDVALRLASEVTSR